MSLNIIGRHLEVTPAIREYVLNKLARALRHVDDVIDSTVTLAVERVQHMAEITVRVPGKDMHCEVVDEDLYAAIDLLADKVDRQLLKHKTKTQNHAHAPLKRQLDVTA